MVESLGSVPSHGYSADQLQQTIQAFGLAATVVKCNLDALKQSGSIPAIVHFESFSPMTNQTQGHFCVLVACDKKTVSLIDGTTARLEKVPIEEFVDFWSGYAVVAKARPGWIASWVESPLITILLGGIAMWLLSLRCGIFRFLGRLLPATAVFVMVTMSTSISAALAMDVQDVLKAVEQSHGLVGSLDVRVEVTDIDLKSSQKGVGKPTRQERFAFKGANRVFEQTAFEKSINPRHLITILGPTSYQQMTNRENMVVGRRDQCPEATFTGTCYGLVTGWEFDDPTITSEDLRRQQTQMSLTSVLRNASYKITESSANSLTLQSPVERVVLDPSKGYGMVSRRITLVKDGFVEFRNADFVEFTRGVWLPKRGEYETKEESSHTLVKWNVLELQVNSVGDLIFEKELSPRSGLADLREAPPGKTAGIPMQRIAAGPLDFDKTIGSVGVRRTFIAINVIAILAIAAYWIYTRNKPSVERSVGD